MNTKKTLADAQPGGRVRLGDALLPCPFCGNGAEFVPYKDNGLTLKCKSMGCIQRHQRTLRYGIEWLRTSMTEHWNARALSAQPSPGGQGNSLATLAANWSARADEHDENAREADSIGDMTATVQYLETKSEVLRQVAAELESALAARQPVGWQPMESAPKDGTVVLGLLEGSDIPQSIRFRDGWEIAWDGYRIPAHDGPLRWAPLYAATPAQQPAQVYLDGLDRALGEAIDQRDRYHEMADDLAEHIAAITGVDIGEHSSANCPWQNAIEAAEEYTPAQAVSNAIDMGYWGGPHIGLMLNKDWPEHSGRVYLGAPAQAVDLGPVHAALQAAARSLRTIADSTKDTEFLETAHEIRAYANSRANCAEQAVTDSQAVGK